MQVTNELFLNHARRFCRWFESATHDIGCARQILLNLMHEIPNLVWDGLDTSCSREHERRGYKRWQADHHRLADLPFQYYRMVFDPLNLETEDSVVADLHDDLADIYGDLWHGFQGYDAGDIGYAFEYWQTSYHQHWGNHAASAIHAIEAHLRN